MNYTTLVSAEQLAGYLDDAHWIVFDCRHDLAEAQAGRRAYQAGHIRNARHAQLDEDLSGAKNGRNGRHPLPDPAAFGAWLGRMGVANDTQVVAYDDAGGMFAARLWWMLRWLGHDAVAVLDGGLPAWLRAGRPLSDALPAVTPVSFIARPQATWVNADFVQAHLQQPGMLLIDARSPDRFRGENETLDPVGGHIPGASNRFFKNNLDADGRFKPAAQLRQEFGQMLGTTPPAQVVQQCGSGVTACHNLLAMEIAGLPGAKLYVGSWSEWCSDPRRPVSRQ